MKTVAKCLVLLLVLTSCAPAQFTPFTPPEVKYDRSPPYSVEESLAAIPKPAKMEPIYVRLEPTANTDVVTAHILADKDQATHILLVPSEYAKIGGVLKVAKAYKAIAVEQEHLVNTYISQINILKELLELERQKTIMYKELWVDSENAYRQEKFDHKMDNMFHRGVIGTIVIGAIVALVISL